MPIDFNFSAKIGSGTYLINTYDNTLTKTIDWQKDTAITIVVSQEFKESIYKELKRIDILRYPINYSPTSVFRIALSILWV